MVTSKKLVVILDDEFGSEGINFEKILETTQNLTKDATIEIKAFSDPVDCFKFVEENKSLVAMVISDFVMPCIDGISFLQEIDQLDKNIKCVLMSGFDDINRFKKHKNLFAVIEKDLELNESIAKLLNSLNENKQQTASN